MLDTLGHVVGRPHDDQRRSVPNQWEPLVFASVRSWPRTPRLRVVDLFSSIGGLTCGLGSAAASIGFGTKVQLAADIDGKALQVYARNFAPSVGHHGSVADLVAYQVAFNETGCFFVSHPVAKGPLAELVGTIDVVIGGPPCQGHSNFNNNTRRRDPRNSLYLTAVSVAIAVGATSLILENVPEVTRSDLRVIEAAMTLMKAAGYNCDQGVLAAHELGWPQTRKRHFFVASKHTVTPLAEVAREYAAAPIGCGAFLSKLPSRTGNDLLNQSPDYSDETRRRLRFFAENPSEFDLPLYERPDCHKEGTSYKSVYGRMRPDEPAPTLTSGFLTPGRGRFVHPTELRTLTPGEAAYVQAFPTWFDFGTSDEVNRNDLSKWIGDAVPLPLGYVASMAVLPGVAF